MQDLSIPFFYHLIFSNPFPDTHSSALSSRQQLFALFIIGSLYVSSSKVTATINPQQSATKTN